MNIAYLISAHTDAPQLKRLVDALHRDAHFFVHVDRKADIGAFTALLCRENVHFVEPRVDVRWGTVLQVAYQRVLFRAVLNFPVAFDRVFFLSGLDYPLWSNERITAWLETHPEQEFLSGICMDGGAICAEQRELYEVARPFFNIPLLGNRWNGRLGIVCREAKRLLGMRKRLSFEVDGKRWLLYKGADWWCVSRDLLLYIYKCMEREEVRRYFVDSFAPSETIVQTIAFNSEEWRERCMLWEGAYPGLAALTPLHHIVYDPVIKVMDEGDYDTLMASGKMFTRKVVSGKSDLLVKMLDGRE